MRGRGTEAFDQLINNYEFETVLDIGSGPGFHAKAFRESGKEVITCDLAEGQDYMDFEIDPVDCIWCCHVLEHQRNPGIFLDKVFKDLKEGGVLAITVPPMKHTIVGGHLTLWNAGLVLYHLVLAGFDCKEVRIKEYDYNISVIVEKKSIEVPELIYDAGDLETLKEYLPEKVNGPFNGNIREMNWEGVENGSV